MTWPIDVSLTPLGNGQFRVTLARRCAGVLSGVDFRLSVDELAALGEEFSLIAAEARRGVRWRTGEKRKVMTGRPGPAPSAPGKSK